VNGELEFFPGPAIHAVPFEKAKGVDVPFGMAEVRAPAGTMTAKYRVRECGDYMHANFNNEAYPGLHSIQEVSQVLPDMHFAIDIEEVTNGQYAEFARATHRGFEQNGGEHQPATNVNLDDARAYAKWKGKRLPTEWEWQAAAMQNKIHRGSPLVWNMTESEHTDGITDFIWLKGGSEQKVEGSDWYADGGHQEPDFMAKFIRITHELDRCKTVGFRCAMDL
jgi:formylglycine-generating enzyme required for sulfatase activity